MRQSCCVSEGLSEKHWQSAAQSLVACVGLRSRHAVSSGRVSKALPASSRSAACQHRILARCLLLIATSLMQVLLCRAGAGLASTHVRTDSRHGQHHHLRALLLLRHQLRAPPPGEEVHSHRAAAAAAPPPPL